jgi:hypothetical protein
MRHPQYIAIFILVITTSNVSAVWQDWARPYNGPPVNQPNNRQYNPIHTAPVIQIQRYQGWGRWALSVADQHRLRTYKVLARPINTR